MPRSCGTTRVILPRPPGSAAVTRVLSMAGSWLGLFPAPRQPSEAGGRIQWGPAWDVPLPCSLHSMSSTHSPSVNTECADGPLRGSILLPFHSWQNQGSEKAAASPRLAQPAHGADWSGAKVHRAHRSGSWQPKGQISPQICSVWSSERAS